MSAGPVRGDRRQRDELPEVRVAGCEVRDGCVGVTTRQAVTRRSHQQFSAIGRYFVSVHARDGPHVSGSANARNEGVPGSSPGVGLAGPAKCAVECWICRPYAEESSTRRPQGRRNLAGVPAGTSRPDRARLRCPAWRAKMGAAPNARRPSRSQLSNGVTTAQNSASDMKKPGCGPDTLSMRRSRNCPPGVWSPSVSKV
jgi:hypothetical protein